MPRGPRLLKRAAKDCLLLVGAPLRLTEGCSTAPWPYNQGRCLGIIPKSYLPNFREFYEARQFAPARLRVSSEVSFLGETVPFTPDLIFRCADQSSLCVGCEVCQDVWGARAAVLCAMLARRDRRVQPLRVQHHDRQGRVPESTRPVHGGEELLLLRVLLGGSRRVYQRRGLGRPVHHL